MKCQETELFLHLFTEPRGSCVIEIGSHDESSEAACVLSNNGYKVIAVDLREPNRKQAGTDYEYLRADWCSLPSDFLREHVGKVDSIYSISAIEHFGLGAYGEGPAHDNYDITAMFQAWQMLKENGTMYVSVPFAGSYFCWQKQWRVYDRHAVMNRLVQDFKLELADIFFSGGGGILRGKQMYVGDRVSFEDAAYYCGVPPHLTVFMKLRKIRKNRISPDGYFK